MLTPCSPAIELANGSTGGNMMIGSANSGAASGSGSISVSSGGGSESFHNEDDAVATSVKNEIYPHRNGPPTKRMLREADFAALLADEEKLRQRSETAIMLLEENSCKSGPNDLEVIKAVTAVTADLVAATETCFANVEERLEALMSLLTGGAALTVRILFERVYKGVRERVCTSNTSR
jgi:hypothetical protein